ncbi:MAG: type II toxin-antitoxin system VapC family toxin [Sporichthyaceae bacterium]
MTDAFDADVLVYAAGEFPLGGVIRGLLNHIEPKAGVGSVLLLPEVLSKPRRDGRADEVAALIDILEHLHLWPVDNDIAELAVDLGATYRQRAPDAVHLATAVLAGAERFITINRRDFGPDINEIDVVYPDQL